MELFTLLSIVNNSAFTELMASTTDPQSAKTGEHRIHLPSWSLQLVGTLSPNDFAAVQPQITWGALLGFPEDPWGYSPEFREAVTRLEAMGIDESVKKCVSKLSIRWVSKLQAADVRGDQMLVTFDDPSTPFRGQFRELFDAIAPPIAQMWATHGCTSLVTETEPPQLKTEACEFVSATVWDWAHSAVPEVTTALTRTSISSLMLSLERGWMNSRQAVMNAGFLLNSLVCGRFAVSGGDNRIVSDAIHLEYDTLDLSCDTGCNWLCEATCSAVAESSVEMHLGMKLAESTRWLWLIYALCCGSSDALVWAVNISRCELTKSDIVVIAAVLQTNYPKPILEQKGKGCHQYGFVDIQEGAELRLGGVYAYRDSGFVVSRACRCRALYNTADGEWVNVVVPGYGACRAKLGGGIRFTPDSGTQDFREKRLSGRLELNDVRLETTSVLMDMLTLITRGLRKLTVNAVIEDATASAIQIDLCVLSTACPDLQDLSISGFTVMVSSHNKSLRHWPVKNMYLSWSGGCTSTLPDLTGCLRDPELRMARQLTDLDVRPPCGSIDMDQVRELRTHDFECLSLVKKKFPVTSKTAVISVVMSASNATKSIHHLDANILNLIFVFASTPARRFVKCWTEEDYESDW